MGNKPKHIKVKHLYLTAPEGVKIFIITSSKFFMKAQDPCLFIFYKGRVNNPKSQKVLQIITSAHLIIHEQTDG